MWRLFRALVPLLAMIAACSATLYSVQRPGLDCQRAVRVVRRTLIEMGYTITDMVEPKGASSGFVSGTKRTADGKTTKGSVRISCSGTGAQVQPIEDSVVPSFEFSRGFDYSFTSLVQRPDVENPRVASGVQVLVQVVDMYEARLDFGGEAVSRGDVLVRLTVRNATDRAVAVDRDRLTLITADGTSAQALDGPALDAAVVGPGAARVRQELLGTQLKVPAGMTAFRFLVYPSGSYREARLSVEDVETGESDGFVTAVE